MTAVTLAEAQKNTQTALDVSVINEFRKSTAILDSLIFDQAVNPAGGGAVLQYAYRRQTTQRNAAFRAYNTEYVDESVNTEVYTTTLAPLGGSFSVDRVIAELGPAASGTVALEMSNLITATGAKFADSVINGDIAVDANGFDGLSKALTGTSTEMVTTADWTDFDTGNRAEHRALDLLDTFLALLDGSPTIILGNARVLSLVRAAGRRANMYVKSPVEGLIGSDGRPIEREYFGGAILQDAGAKAGSNNPVIPILGNGTTSLYAYRSALDGFHGVATTTGRLVRAWLPDFTTARAVKPGEAELGPVGVALKKTKSAAVLRGIKVS